MAKPKTSTRSHRLTLYLDGPQITAERFQKAIGAFFALIDDVAEEVTGKTKQVRWIVSANRGSLLLHADPMPANPSVPVGLIAASIHHGLGQLGQKAQRPKWFNDSALRRARELGAIVDGKEVGLAKVLLAQKPTVVKQDTVQHVDRILGVRVKDYGTIEGQLQMVSIRGGPHFAVSDALTGRSIQCLIPPEKMEDAIGAFPRRVAVQGVLRYNQQGEPVSVDVEDLQTLPERAELPSAEDVYGILSRSE